MSFVDLFKTRKCVFENEKFCIQNEKLCVKNDDFAVELNGGGGKIDYALGLSHKMYRGVATGKMMNCIVKR